ncbi:MAG: Poly(A) polymerase I [Chlamydiae bacterium]|nr:Poly(A) polymerase I [Chlamydiota bacterium]
MPPKIFLDSSHPISEKTIDSDALKVIHRLKRHGYSAYLVGGGVRDLLLNIPPKDFDIATSAKPDEIRALFRNCLLIGKRFRLAHIRFGNKVLEVSTFRAGQTKDANFITNDNEFGTEEEDAMRRDFTINGLLYDPEEHAIIDYVKGLKDIENRILRTIGNPTIRFCQDPVRMIRLIKFQARIDFSIEEETQKALKENIEEILKSSPDRILGELFKILETKVSSKFFKLMDEYGFTHLLFPQLANSLDVASKEQTHQFLQLADQQEIHQPEKNVLLACFLFPLLERKIQTAYLDQDKMPHLGEIYSLTKDLIRDTLVAPFPRFPRWMRETIAFILNAQYRFTPLDPNKKNRKFKMMGHKKFPLALRFLGLRSFVDDRCAREYSKFRRINNRNKI